MILSSHLKPKASSALINFLQQRFSLSENALSLGIRQAKNEQAPLPIVLWSFGLLDIRQYQEVLDWQRDNQ